MKKSKYSKSELVEDQIHHGYRTIYSYIQFYGINDDLTEKEKKEINSSKDVIFYIPIFQNLRFFVIEKYFLKYAQKVEFMQNNIIDNNPKIYIAYFKETQKKEIYYIHRYYYFNNDLFINNISLEEILCYYYKKEKNISVEKEDVIVEILCQLKKKLNINDDNELVSYLYWNYSRKAIINYHLAEIISLNYQEENNENIEKLWDYYDSLLMKMLNVKKSDLKRTTELTYLKIVKDYFPDVIYQYRCKWLGKMSLDLYIPSKKIAFEVQGKQHYEAIDFFGGESQLKVQKERDERKRKLCNDNGVKLYYIGDFENIDIYDILNKYK